MKLLISLIFIMLSGCFFARVDWEPDRKSATVWTIGKDYGLVDPNFMLYSESNRVKVITPYGTGETK